ncbi:MAG TPA: hypothetical protein VG502_04145 [Flexivirga sp.]|uniref:hypothetical protein n=1 Tax=Flexivirga sp. TaxID=1962927 RepID=UPI002BA38E27|nr:hypothetical protein [Flexivirga sp.]HWC21472.1 hypothetical protein [Flexivirga sp.]
MPLRRNRANNPGDREVHRLYGASADAGGGIRDDLQDEYEEDARPARYAQHSERLAHDPEEYDEGPVDGLDHDPEDESDWAAFGEDGFFEEEHRPRGPIRRTLGCLIPIALVAGIAGGGYLAYQHLVDNFGSPSCKLVAKSYDYQWDPDQTQSASTIVAVGVYKKGVPTRAAIVATTTAIQESKLRNLAYGDLDSLGLFQQRKSQGWGSAEQIQDPVFSSGSFYNALLKVPNWETMPIGEAAQAVQHSGFPDAYAQHESQGDVITSVMTGAVHEGIGCRLDPPKKNGSAAQIAQQLSTESGLRATANAKSVDYQAKSVDGAFAVASWAIAHADADNITAVTVGDRAWERHRGRDGWSWHPAKQSAGGPTAVRIDVETGK